MPARTPVQNSKPSRRGLRNAQRATPVALPETLALVRPLLRWFAVHARDLPWRRTLDPYAIWISEIMLQQTQVKTVIPYYERWLRALPTVRALATASPDKVLKLWEGLGYYTRARNLQRAAQQIVREHGGRFPRDFDAVLALPGIGRYTAGAVCSIAFNQPAPLLDGNVIRVLCRLFALRDNPRQTAANARLWERAAQLVTAAARFPLSDFPPCTFPLSGPCSALNQALMELGATVCTPRQPRCAACPLRANCAARARGLAQHLPNLGPRAATTARRFCAFVVVRRGRVLVRRRPSGGVNAGLWEFPHVETGNGSPAPLAWLRERLGTPAAGMTPLCTVTHSITRHRLTVEAGVVTLAAPPARAPEGARWVRITELDHLAFTAAHRKILRAYLGRRQRPDGGKATARA